MNKTCVFIFFTFISLYGYSQIDLKLSSQKIEGTILNEQFGNDFENIGDVNNDGYNDLAVYSFQSKKIGIYAGTNTFYEKNPFFEIDLKSENISPVFGGKGDINGDSIDDLVIGLPKDHGEILVYNGGKILSNIPNQTLKGVSSYGKFATSFTIDCDLNKDGIHDLVVGEPYRGQGFAYVHLGTNTGLNLTKQSSLSFGDTYHRFGMHITKGGDFNNDTYDDVIIASEKLDSEYRSYPYCAFFGTSKGLEPTTYGKYWDFNPYINYSKYGMSAKGLGDITGDGIDDIIFSYSVSNKQYFRFYKGEKTSKGIGRVVTDFKPWYTSKEIDVKANHVISNIGDFNKDGLDDVAIIFDVKTSFNAKTYAYGISIHEMTPSGLNIKPNFIYSSKTDTNALVKCIGIGDLNSDGFSDILISNQYAHSKGEIVTLLGVSDLYLDIRPDSERMCLDGNIFNFLAETLEEYESLEWTIDNKSYNTNLSVHENYTFSNYGKHIVKAKVIDKFGFEVTDSIEIFVQHPLFSGTYPVGINESISSVVQLHDSLKCGIQGDIEIEFTGLLDSSLIIHSPKIYGNNNSITLKSKKGERATVPGLSITNFNNVKIDSIIFHNKGDIITNDLDYQSVNFTNVNNLKINNSAFYFFHHRPYNLYLEACDNMEIEGNHFAYTTDQSEPNVTDLWKHTDWIYYRNIIYVKGGNNFKFNNNDILLELKFEGIRVNSVSGVEIFDNKLDGKTLVENYSNWERIGLVLGGCKDINVQRNQIFGVDYGMFFVGIDTLNTNQNIVANNSIGGELGADWNNAISPGKDDVGAGVRLHNCNKLNLYHNSIYLDNRCEGVYYKGAALDVSRSSNIIIKNNLLVASGFFNRAYNFDLDENKNIISDYNVIVGEIAIMAYSTVFNSSTNDYIRLKSSPYTNMSQLSEVLTVTNNDHNSIQLDTMIFEKWNKLIPTKYLNEMSSFASPISEVTTDFYGNLRNEKFVFPGAFEVTNPVSSNDDVLLSIKNVMYPNPANEYVYINIEDNFNYRLITIQGEIIKKGENQKNKIELKNIPAGTYFLEIETDNVRRFEKLVINH